MVTRRLRLVLSHIDLLLDFGRAREGLERSDPQAAIGARAPDVMGAELVLRRAACHFALGSLDETLTTLQTRPSEGPTRSLFARFLELEGRTRMVRGEYEKARAAFERAHRTAADAALVELTEALDAKIGVVLLYEGDYAQALYKLEEGLTRARNRGEARALADLLGHIGMIQAARMNDSEASACFTEAIEIAQARGVRADLGRWSGQLGMLKSQLGDHEAAKEHLDRALDIARETGGRQSEATWHGELGIHYVRSQEEERASLELTRCLAISREIGFSLYEAWAQIYLGALALERTYDDVETARDRVEIGLEIAERLSHRNLQVEALLMLGRACQAGTDPSAARPYFERAERIAGDSQDLRLKARVRDAVGRPI